MQSVAWEALEGAPAFQHLQAHGCQAVQHLACRGVHVQVGACEEVLVDACQSAGSGGRPLRFSFAAASRQLLPPTLLAALPSNSTGDWLGRQPCQLAVLLWGSVCVAGQQRH